MIDSENAIKTNWKIVRNRTKYQYELRKIEIAGKGIMSNISFDVKSAFTTICGKNGAGKTNILKSINALFKNNISDSDFFNSPNSFVEIYDRASNESKKYGQIGLPFERVVYLDPSDDSILIRKLISNDATFKEDYVDEQSENDVLEQAIGYIKKIISNKINKVTVIEVEGKLPDEQILPYFRVQKRECSYDSLQMGQGEHKILYFMWKLLTMENNSILLLEEPESFLCSKSQEYLIDFMVSIISKKKLHVVLSTHSEMFLKGPELSSCAIIKRDKKDCISLISEKHKSKYISALGLEPTKKGVFLVEDRFAQLMLKRILQNSGSPLYQEFFVDELKGESHIVCVAKHYHSNNIKLIAVLDADQVGKLDENDCLMDIAYLPCDNNLSPEETIISCIENNKVEFAKLLPLHDDFCLDKLEEITADHHDWFIELGKLLSFEDINLLKSHAIYMWISKNADIIDRFVLALENSGRSIQGIMCKDGDCYYTEISGIKFDIEDEIKKKINLDVYEGKKTSGVLKYVKGCLKFQPAFG